MATRRRNLLIHPYYNFQPVSPVLHRHSFALEILKCRQRVSLKFRELLKSIHESCEVKFIFWNESLTVIYASMLTSVVLHTKLHGCVDYNTPACIHTYFVIFHRWTSFLCTQLFSALCAPIPCGMMRIDAGGSECNSMETGWTRGKTASIAGVTFVQI